MLLCAALAAYPARGSGGAVRLLVVGGVVAGLIVAITLLFEWETLAPWALGVLGAEYTGSLYVHGGASGNATPVYAAGLLLLGELIALSLAHQARLHEERPVLLLRLATIGLAVVGSAAVAAALLSLGTAQTGSGVGWTLAGTAAAVACVALVVRAVRSEH